MSRVYVMSKHTDVIKRSLESNPIIGMRLHHKPLDQDGKPSLWPYSVTDGQNYGWFEEDMILFWGSNNETPILAALKEAGFQVVSSF